MAAPSDLELINDGLIRIGEKPIQSFAANTEVSNAAAIVWPNARKFLLSAYPWAFSQKWVQLSQVAEPTVPGQNWLYQYELPSESIRLNSVWYGGTSTPGSSVIGGAGNPYTTVPNPSTGQIGFNQQADEWQLFGNTILCNYPYLAVFYSVDVPSTLQWSPQFGEMMVAYFAWKMAYSRSKSASVQQNMEQTYLRVSATARHNESIGRPSERVGQQGYSRTLGSRNY